MSNTENTNNMNTANTSPPDQIPGMGNGNLMPQKQNPVTASSTTRKTYNPSSNISQSFPVTDEEFHIQAVHSALNDYKKQTGNYPSCQDYLSNPALCHTLTEMILLYANTLKRRVNVYRGKGEKFPILKSLPHEAIVALLYFTDDFRNVKMNDSGDSDMLYMRMETGPDQGTFRYQSGGDTAKNYGCQNELMNLMTALKPNIKNADRKEIVGKLLAQVPKCRPNSDTFLVPCANGVYDEHRRLRGEDPFVSYDDPLFKKEYRDVVFTNKLDTAYNKNASDDLLIKDGFKWSLDRQDGSSGLDAIFGTDQLGATEKQLYLMIAQFAVRRTSGGRTWFFVDGTEYGNGANGKDTILQLLRNVIGPTSVMSTPITDLASNNNNYKMGDLADTIAIIASEADNTHTIVKCALLKNLMREQPVDCRKIYSAPYTYTYRGVIIQALNNPALKTTDTTESMWRKAEFLTFRTTFVETGRSFINDDYINRKTVKEAFLKMILEQPFLMEYPKELLAVIKDNKQATKEASNPIFSFCDQVFLSWQGKYIPEKLLWDMYKVYNEDNELHYMPEEAQFKRDVQQWIGAHIDEWEIVRSKTMRLSVHDREPIVVEFLNRPVAKRMDIARQWLPEKDGAVDISGAFSRKATAGTYKPGYARVVAYDHAKNSKINRGDLKAIPEDYFEYVDDCLLLASEGLVNVFGHAKPYQEAYPELAYRPYTLLEWIFSGKASIDIVMDYNFWKTEYAVHKRNRNNGWMYCFWGLSCSMVDELLSKPCPDFLNKFVGLADSTGKIIRALMTDPEHLDAYTKNDPHWLNRFTKYHPHWLQKCLKRGPEWLGKFMTHNQELTALLLDDKPDMIHRELKDFLICEPDFILKFLAEVPDVTSSCMAKYSDLRKAFSKHNHGKWVCLHCHTVNEASAKDCVKCGTDREHAETRTVANPFIKPGVINTGEAPGPDSTDRNY